MSKQDKETRAVTSHDIHLDGDYATWIADLKHRYRTAQVKAAVRVNAEKLLFNWQLGRDLVLKRAEQRWGTGVVEQVSLDLQREFPGEKGFSCANLWFMKKWYLFYSNEDAMQKLYQLGREIGSQKLYQRIKDALPTGEQLRERMELLQKELRRTKRLFNNQHNDDE